MNKTKEIKELKKIAKATKIKGLKEDIRKKLKSKTILK